MKNKNKNRLSLNGDWIYVKDAGEKLAVRDIFNLLNTNIKHSQMRLPLNWEPGGLHNFSGAVWFVKYFKSTDDAPDNLKLLKFMGVDYFAEVWLNWNYLGKHEGYFAPFYFNATKHILDKNVIVIKVSSPNEFPGKVWPDRKQLIKGIFNHHDCRPGGTSLQFGQDQNTGGIWNDILLQSGHKIYIENVKITSSLAASENKAAVLINIKYLSAINTAKKIKTAFTITSPDNETKIYQKLFQFKSGKGEINYRLEINNPQLWWSWDLGKPNLYHIIISSESFEAYEQQFGIRQIHLDEISQFVINGKRLFLRGTNIIPEQFLSNLTVEKIKKIVSLIKEANINIVRVHAHVNRKELYEEFDRQGILVWQDFSLQWTYDTSESFKLNALQQIKEMVNYLYNHPSIAFWCCHNEPGEQIKTLDPRLEKMVLSEDTSRIIRRASNYEEHPYDGWYWGKKEHFIATPMGPVVTEFGAQALPNKDSLKKIIPKQKLFPPDWKEWEYHNFQVDQTFNVAQIETGNSLDSFISNSQHYQSDLLKTAIDFYRCKKNDGITGIFQFMFIDCWPSISWSVVDYFGEKKSGYETIKSSYKPVYICVLLKQNRYFPGKKIAADVYLINDLHENYDNCNLIFFIDGTEHKRIKSITLGADSKIFFTAGKINLMLSERTKPGKHYLKVILNNKKKKLISESLFEIEVVDNPC
jgi:beta-mannosidase